MHVVQRYDECLRRLPMRRCRAARTGRRAPRPASRGHRRYRSTSAPRPRADRGGQTATSSSPRRGRRSSAPDRTGRACSLSGGCSARRSLCSRRPPFSDSPRPVSRAQEHCRVCHARRRPLLGFDPAARTGHVDPNRSLAIDAVIDAFEPAVEPANHAGPGGCKRASSP